MKHGGRFVVGIALGLAMTLGMCPTQGIADEIEVRSEGDEAVVEVESGAEVVSVQPDDDIALEAQDTQTEPAAIVQSIEGDDSLHVYDFTSVEDALVYWAGLKFNGSSGGDASLILLKDQVRSNTDTLVVYGRYKSLDLNGHTLDMNGSTIQLMADGGNSPTFVLEDSTDSGTGDSAGLLKNCRIDMDPWTAGTFVMASGTLTYDGSTNGGQTDACIKVGRRGEFYMRGGTIKAIDSFALVSESMDDRVSRLSGGVIEGGVYFRGRSDGDGYRNHFVMSGGAITNQNGAGVIVGQNSVFTMTGGTIERCTDGGVSVGPNQNSVFKVSGAPVVTGNTKGDAAQNVYLPADKTITVEGPLADGARIGVTTESTPTAENPVVLFTTDYGSNNPGGFPAKHFSSDLEPVGFQVVWDDDATKAEAALKLHQHSWKCDVAGNVLTARCVAEHCVAEGGSEQTLTLSVEGKAYDGEPVAASIATSMGWSATRALVGEIAYYEGGTELSTAPRDAGTYEARVKVRIADSEQIVKAPFSITRVALTVTANDNTVAYGKMPAGAGVTYAGFVGGENAGVLAGKLSYDFGGCRAGSPAGTYPITPRGLSSRNYDIAYQAGVLSVKPQPSPKPKDLPKNVSVKAVARVRGRRALLTSTGVGKVVGTTGKSRRLESLRLSLSDQPLPGGIEYRAYVQKVGWQGWKANGGLAGTRQKARRIEAVRICLTGQMGEQYNVYYRVYAQGYGWMAWARNGTRAGSIGLSRRIEAVQVVVVRKGDPAPGKTYNGVKQTYGKAFKRK